jgi:hypothetical protein
MVVDSVPFELVVVIVIVDVNAVVTVLGDNVASERVFVVVPGGIKIVVEVDAFISVQSDSVISDTVMLV